MTGVYNVGIDIGSACAKTVALDSDGQIIWYDLRPTGWSSVETAGAILADLQGRPDMEKAALADLKGRADKDVRIVATGYGRVSVPFADKCVTEISCHAKGAAALFKADRLNLIDIGGQDTKLIIVENGVVSEFAMNDKCSAGTGRFLELMANTLSVTPAELCRMAEKGRATRISSLCTVFAESEVINLIGRGTPREDIAFAVVDSIAQKVKTQAVKVTLIDGPLYLTGGLCEFPFVCERLGKAFGREVLTSPKARFAGALGAALFASAL